MLISKKLYKIIASFACLILLICTPYISKSQSNNEILLANEYFEQGDVDKALVIYEELAKKKENILLIHKNYFDLLLSSKDFKKAKSYIKKVNRFYPNNPKFKIDEGIYYLISGDKAEANEIFEKIINEKKKDQQRTRSIAQYFFHKQYYTWAEKAYLDSRKALKKDNIYGYELANIYILSNNKDKMLNEYLNILKYNASNINYIKNVLQRTMKEPEDIDSLEEKLVELVQEDNKRPYVELLIWTNLQQKDFYGAFVQARALEIREKGNGEKVYEIGSIALSNKDYEMAIEIFDYITSNFSHTPFYALARKNAIKAKSEHVKSTYPVDLDAINNLIAEYDKLFLDIGANKTSLEGIRNQAMLHAFYLHQFDTAKEKLNFVIDNARTGRSVRLKAKMDLGDLHIFTQEPWESSLLYSQVEKEAKSTPIAYEAKFKNAKLSYFNGDFDLAKAHLDILKEGTTKKIANDAMALSLLIKDNTGLDSTEYAMKRYSAIDLMLFQNKKDSALLAIDKMLDEFPGHSLTDELHWAKANIFVSLGQDDQAIASLELLIEDYSHDILGDDAHFLLANLYEKTDKNKAMELYQEFLIKHKGSIFTSEARKKFRMLRGDEVY
ncbi:tetratricopeptide repeat protein [Aureibacter tunicatorum]|uniref:Zn-dependent protease n=1 Tax=Aureibacter tunicatorum TaxID=866807 RepID=A0AAE4BR80_9BACT|nr:tetratricopeptide repeat protein [Aureibacter tunicatorum]MDR6237490.1 putative Zn-dependent protease [Aureibacter tunicatorum]BDD02524.1 hypothetical protein AUTU_00070 [Aureibacter tunicatorum]